MVVPTPAAISHLTFQLTSMSPNSLLCWLATRSTTTTVATVTATWKVLAKYLRRSGAIKPSVLPPNYGHDSGRLGLWREIRAFE